MKAKLASAPYLVWMALFIIIPLGLIVYFAFTNEDGSFTFEHILNVSQYTPILAKSIGLAAVATVICLIIAYPLAFITPKSSRHEKIVIIFSRNFKYQNPF